VTIKKEADMDKLNKTIDLILEMINEKKSNDEIAECLGITKSVLVGGLVFLKKMGVEWPQRKNNNYAKVARCVFNSDSIFVRFVQLHEEGLSKQDALLKIASETKIEVDKVKYAIRDHLNKLQKQKERT